MRAGMVLSAPFAMAADGDMTGEELTALLGAGKKINLGGDGEGYSGSLDIKGDGTASGSVQAQGNTTQLKGHGLSIKTGFAESGGHSTRVLKYAKYGTRLAMVVSRCWLTERRSA